MRHAIHLAVALALIVPAGAGATRAQAADPTVYMVRYIEVAPASQAEGAALVKKLAEASRKEAGNLAFNAMQQTARKNHFEVVEIWADQKAEDTHETNAATKDYRAKVQPLLGAHYDRRWYKQL